MFKMFHQNNEPFALLGIERKAKVTAQKNPSKYLRDKGGI